MPLTDSHCHLNFPGLREREEEILAAMREHGVLRALNISTQVAEFDQVLGFAERHAHIWATVGVHPDTEHEPEVDQATLVARARHPKVLALGETGLDYYRLEGRSHADMQWQRDRFAVHIQAAREVGKPLVIHTRAAAEDTLAMLREQGAADCGGVFHCFTESWEVARAALDLGFYISLSGILTFKNAKDLQEVAKKLPEDRILVETDSPYLAPVPHRGQTNQPGYTRFVARFLAQLRGCEEARVEAFTEANFDRLFKPLAH
ncbi:MAG: TatD family hydrolase [Betaproteobacteria bacterium]|nr:TatD family hydrolase [Betaproteobacteria bacterium]MDE1955447.1 TatD family hydrolase [Betaproteobacteria bacterium]MDE2153444.1 TatD family hydrolase [Betaproteobacteria bacterium]